MPLRVRYGAGYDGNTVTRARIDKSLVDCDYDRRLLKHPRNCVEPGRVSVDQEHVAEVQRKS